MSRRWTMSSYSLNTTLNSYVNELAYLPLRSPVRAWVCRVGSKGSFASFIYNSAYAFLRLGFFFRSLLARLKKVLSGSIFHIIGAHNSLNKFLLGCASYRLRVLLRLQHALNHGLAPALSIGKIGGKIFDLANSGFRKLREDVFEMFYFINCGIHGHIISQTRSEV